MDPARFRIAVAAQGTRSTATHTAGAFGMGWLAEHVGVRAALAGRPVLCPHDPGTVEHDAFYAGVDAGKKIYCHTEDR